ncbi:MAG: YdcF family protein [Deltaproteobacteria bacterium]|nr:YdcF family protein [Deltaproteobacteria bacterium]
MHDVIVVLGDALRPDGSLSQFGRDRVARGVELLRSDTAPWMIVSGKGPGRGPGLKLPIEAVAMRELALSLGAGAEQLLLEEESDSTLQNAYFTKVRILEPRGFRRLLLVTSEWHLGRAKLTFERILGRAYSIEPIPVPDELAGEALEKKREKETYFTGEMLAQLQGMDEPNHALLEALIAQRRGAAAKPG